MVETAITSPTKAIAEFVARATYDDLPAHVVESAKVYILDSITNMIGGAKVAPGMVVLELYGELGGKPESTIMATGEKVPCLNATYVNAALNNLLDFDDCYLYISHPGATVIPPALSLGEKLGATGKDVINAVVLGYEVSLRICDAIRATPERFEQVWGMATWQIFGAATVAAKLFALDADRVAVALGHAGMSAPVPFLRKMGLEPDDRPFTWLKNNFGWAAMGGVLAAELAARGMEGTKNIFDGPKGFWVMAGSDRCDFERLTAGLGREFLMPATGIKPYASCRWTHTTLDALHEVIGANQIEPSKVARIVVRGITALHEMFDVRQPAHIVDTQFALPPLVALTVAGYSPSAGIAEDHLGDPIVQDLIAKTRLEVAPGADRRFHDDRQMPTEVIVEMEDGRRFEAKQAIAKGEPERPVNMGELRGKFLAITMPLIGAQRAERILDAVERLETVENVAELTGI